MHPFLVLEERRLHDIRENPNTYVIYRFTRRYCQRQRALRMLGIPVGIPAPNLDGPHRI